VREVFHIVMDLRRAGVSILLVEQNARAALQVADYGYVLETGELAAEGPAATLAANPSIAASYLGRGAVPVESGGVGANAPAEKDNCAGGGERRQ
jgi:branched-chain amino acid transport system ATP-binding protein